MRTIVLAAAFLIGSCADSTSPSENVPADHTLRKGGALHAPGLNDPVQNCATCHGAALRGGANGEPSCFRCHGEVW